MYKCAVLKNGKHFQACLCVSDCLQLIDVMEKKDIENKYSYIIYD